VKKLVISAKRTKLLSQVLLQKTFPPSGNVLKKLLLPSTQGDADAAVGSRQSRAWQERRRMERNVRPEERPQVLDQPRKQADVLDKTAGGALGGHVARRRHRCPARPSRLARPAVPVRANKRAPARAGSRNPSPPPPLSTVRGRRPIAPRRAVGALREDHCPKPRSTERAHRFSYGSPARCARGFMLRSQPSVCAPVAA
jgi:hypothetical protein